MVVMMTRRERAFEAPSLLVVVGAGKKQPRQRDQDQQCQCQFLHRLTVEFDMKRDEFLQ